MYASPSFGNLIVTQVVLCSLLGVFFGPMATALAEQFETHVRSTGLGMAYNMAVMIFGSFCAVLRDLADPNDWRTGSAGFLCDVRRSSRTSRCVVLEGTCPQRRFGHEFRKGAGIGKGRRVAR
jgi:hypothetical protein